MTRPRFAQEGFTIVELLIVIGVIGILAAIAIPNLLTAMQRTKQKRTMADIRSIGVAWEARAIEMNRYNAAGYTLPAVSEAMVDIYAHLEPTYIKTAPRRDGWTNAWEFYLDVAMEGSNSANRYAIVSRGRNGMAEGVVGSGGSTTNFDCDIVYENGNFVQYPDALQID